METEEVFLVLSLLLLFFDLILLLRPKPLHMRRQLHYGFYASILAVGLIVVSYLMLAGAFLSDNFSVKEVYLYGSSSLPLISKLHAFWAGTVLLSVGVTLSALEFVRQRRNDRLKSKYMSCAHASIM